MLSVHDSTLNTPHEYREYTSGEFVMASSPTNPTVVIASELLCYDLGSRTIVYRVHLSPSSSQSSFLTNLKPMRPYISMFGTSLLASR